MAEVVRRADLVVALATVTISALSGPLGSVGVAVAKELVKTCSTVWDRTSPERQLRKAVQTAIESWAEGENVPADTVDRGIGWAIEYVQAAGSPYEVLSGANFDPTEAATHVLAPVKRRDRFWGTEIEYDVAERAIGATYRALCARLKSEGGLLLAAVQASRHAILDSIAGLREELLGLADRDELMWYMRTKIKEWDFSPWTPGKSPSLMELGLQLDPCDDSRQRAAAAEALDGVSLLVVVGGPGAGKTWLAQRYARESAQSALEELADPRVDPALVEIPLLTTWAAWASQPNGGVDGLAAAALPATGETRIKRSVLRPGARVLAVADSLDEGVGKNVARTLLRSLPGPPGWRAVVTSRPEAWHSAAPALTSNEGVRTGTLTELTYPLDVHSYIRRWFTDEPRNAEHLVGQVERRRELRDTATVPLLLTFYCMLTEQDPNNELPWRRRDLYRAVIDRLLTGGWTGDQPRPDLEACRTLLQEWAWTAIEYALTPAGLGDWPAVITTGTAPPELERALDHVAPKQQYPPDSKYDRTRVERRFVHRSLLEHAVAEQIATFPAAHAADLLLRHVWFDPDWAVTVPMAIAAHPHRDAVIDRLWAFHSAIPTPAQQVLNTRLENVLLEAATQTSPSDWSVDYGRTIDDLRVAAASQDFQIVARSAHWTSSNPRVFEALLPALPHAGPAMLAGIRLPEPSTMTDLMSALKAVAPETDRTIARRAISAALSTANPVTIRELVNGLIAFEPTAADRIMARRAILAALPTDNQFTLWDLVDALMTLEPTEVDRAVAREVIVAALPSAKTSEVRELVSVLLTLEPTEGERVIAREAIFTALPNAEMHSVNGLVKVLLTLEPTEAGLAVTREAILAALSSTRPHVARDLVWELLRLEPTENDLVTAREGILAALPASNLNQLSFMVQALLSLDPTETDRAVAREVIVAALPAEEPYQVRNLVGALETLEPTESDRAIARKRIVAVLPATKEPYVVLGLVEPLLAFEPTEKERVTARKTIITALRSDPWGPVDPLPRLVATFLELEPTEKERVMARAAIVAELPMTWTSVDKLVNALTAIESETDRVTVRGAILAALPTAAPVAVNEMLDALMARVASEADRVVVREAIMAVLPDAHPDVVHEVVRALRVSVPAMEWLELIMDR